MAHKNTPSRLQLCPDKDNWKDKGNQRKESLEPPLLWYVLLVPTLSPVLQWSAFILSCGLKPLHPHLYKKGGARGCLYICNFEVHIGSAVLWGLLLGEVDAEDTELRAEL